MKPLILMLVALLPSAASAEVLVATRVIRAGEILQAGDLEMAPLRSERALADLQSALGLEARVILYPGRPILAEQVGPPLLVQRNQLVALVYESNGLAISVDGRALARGGIGESVPVINLASRTTVTGTVLSDGLVRVGRAGE